MNNLMISDSDDEDFQLVDISRPVEKVELPIMKYKDQIIKMVKDNQIIIIHGQTGSGKTTQVPQFLLDAGLNNNGMIGVTQPRKIATSNMAKRVAKERQCALGREVGYEIRFYKKYDASTKIKYMTDGILLNECAQNRNLMNYTIIMIDEAHERSINSDTILGILKIIATRRPELKILISSATLNASKFSEYFNDAPILEVEGRLYPIETIYTDFCENYVRKSSRLVSDIHMSGEEGDILVFLTGEDEIELCCEYLEEIENIVALPLYGAIDMDSQDKVFEKVEEGKRKVIVATNIAETSITIPGIRIVIDCGYVKQSNFDSRRSIDILEIVRVSKAQALQRQGRAGREAPGKCYRLYSQFIYDKLIDETVPEIFRKNLSEIFIKILEIKLDPKELEFIDQPDIEELIRCERELQDLSLVDNNSKLTALGSHVATLPVDPKVGKVMMTSLSKNCSQDILKIISMLTEKFIFIRPKRKRNDADKKIKEFDDPDGDHFTLLRVYNEWSENLQFKENNRNPNWKNRKNYSKAKSWCYRNFVRHHAMVNVEKVYDQIRGMMKKIEGKVDSNSGGKESIKECLISGYFKNICIKGNRGAYTRLYGEETLFIHPSSTLFKPVPKLILFNQVQKTTKPFMNGVLTLDESMMLKFKKEMEILRYPEILDELSRF